MPKNYTQGASEWSYLVQADDIGNDPKTVEFAASKQECTDLARRMNILSVERARATMTLQRAGGSIHAMGMVRADVTQSCIATLAPVTTAIEEEFEGWFGDKNSAVSFAKARSEREAKKAHVEAEILEEASIRSRSRTARSI